MQWLYITPAALIDRLRYLLRLCEYNLNFNVFMLLLYTIMLYNSMKKRLDFRVEEYELKILEDYCSEVGRTKTDVLRELIRSLKTKRKPS